MYSFVYFIFIFESYFYWLLDFYVGSFFFHYFQNVALACVVFNEKSDDVLCSSPCNFSVAAFKNFLFIASFKQFDSDVFLCSFLPFSCAWVSWICGFQFVSNLEKKFSHYFFKYFLVSPHSLSVLWRLQLHTYEVT